MNEKEKPLWRDCEQVRSGQ